jgi:hypothetical protein
MDSFPTLACLFRLLLLAFFLMSKYSQHHVPESEKSTFHCHLMSHNMQVKTTNFSVKVRILPIHLCHAYIQWISSFFIIVVTSVRACRAPICILEFTFLLWHVVVSANIFQFYHYFNIATVNGQKVKTSFLVEILMLTAVVMKKISTFWDITPYIPLKVKRSFGYVFASIFRVEE